MAVWIESLLIGMLHLACRYVIDEIKDRPLFGKEHYS